MFDLNEFLESCEEKAKSDNPLAALRTLLEDVISDAEGIYDALPETDDQEILLYHSDAVTVFNVKLTPGIKYPTHNHHMTALVGIYDGCEENRIYYLGNGKPVERSCKIHHAGDVCIMGPDTVHSVANPEDGPSGALHIYIGDLIAKKRVIWHPEDGSECEFNDENYFGLARPI